MEVEIENSWSLILQNQLNNESFYRLMSFLNEEYSSTSSLIFPEWSKVFRAFEACPFDKLKVVILGQDPYPTAGHAHGLCFSCEANVRPLPKSLQNMFKELESDLGVKAPQNGDLNFWAEEGVLLLNSILTVREGKPLSHANKGWEEFTDAVISVINEQSSGVIFLLWGSPAQQKGKHIDETKHIVIKAPHPSPLSAYRGFFGSKPFSRVNEELKKLGKGEIAWVQ